MADPVLIERLDYERLQPGRHDLRFRAADLPDGTPLTIPLTVLVGRRRRPRLVAIATVHGNEFPGLLALVDLVEALDPAGLDGTVVLAPIANPLAFNAGTRVSPEDGLNLNRVFPGSLDGTLTMRLAHALVHGVVQDADLALDLHSGEGHTIMAPLAGFREPPPGADGTARATALASARAAAAFGADSAWTYWLMKWAPGTLSTALNQQGVPAVGAELGGAGVASAAERDLYRAAVLRCLRHVGISGAPLDVDVPAETWLMEDVTSPASGLLESNMRLGEEVARGAPLARLLDPWGNVLAEVSAPTSGRVLHMRAFRQIRAGDTLLSLGQPVPNPAR